MTKQTTGVSVTVGLIACVAMALFSEAAAAAVAMKKPVVEASTWEGFDDEFEPDWQVTTKVLIPPTPPDEEPVVPNIQEITFNPKHYGGNFGLTLTTGGAFDYSFYESGLLGDGFIGFDTDTRPVRTFRDKPRLSVPDAMRYFEQSRDASALSKSVILDEGEKYVAYDTGSGSDASLATRVVNHKGYLLNFTSAHADVKSQ